MKRIVVVVLCVALVLGCVAGVVVLALDDGPTAASIGDTDVSQQYVDDELRVIGENATLAEAVKQAQGPALSNAEGSVTSAVGSGWLGLIVSTKLAAKEVERRDLETTDADRDQASQLATQAVGGQQIFATLPDWFQDRLVGRFTPVAVLERDVTEDPPPVFLAQINSQCPSGRYVSHILVESEVEALSLKQQLDAGADFAELARRNSTDTGSAREGGQLGCIDGQSFVEPFAAAAASQPIGVVSDPLTTQYGSHLILVSDEPPASLVEQYAIQYVLDRARGAAVHIDPRYGTWDRVSGQVVPPASVTAPTTAPTG